MLVNGGTGCGEAFKNFKRLEIKGGGVLKGLHFFSEEEVGSRGIYNTWREGERMDAFRNFRR